MLLYRSQQVHRVKVVSSDAEGRILQGFEAEQEVSKDHSLIRTLTRTDLSGTSVNSILFDNTGRQIQSTDSLADVRTVIEYTYTLGKLSGIKSSTSTPENSFSTETHEWYYDEKGHPKKMLLIRNGGDTGRIDLVTEVDVAIERMFRQLIAERFPSHAILAEEFGGNEGAIEGPCWVFDPIDGTTNFAHGLPIFCSSLALEVDGVAQVAAVYDPTRREVKRQRARLRRSGKRLSPWFAWTQQERKRLRRDPHLMKVPGAAQLMLPQLFRLRLHRQHHTQSSPRGLVET